MNWYHKYIFAQNLATYLQTLNVHPEVFQYVSDLPSDQANFFVQELRQNPQVSLEQLKSTVVLPQQKESPYLPEEFETVSDFPEKIKVWLLVNLRQARRNRKDIPFEVLTKPGSIDEYYKLMNYIRLFKQGNALIDFLKSNPQIQVDSYTPEDMWNLLLEWHSVLAGKGEGLLYGPTEAETIMYGPKWEDKYNKDKQGWTIQEIKTENDLLVEGNLMDHCVGNYYDEVRDGKMRVFSLRDANNKPYVTFRSDPALTDIDDILGHSNQDPAQAFKSMIKEWVSSLDHDILGESENAIADVVYGDIANVNDRLYEVGTEGRDEYGRRVDFVAFPEDFEYLIEWAQKENRNYRDGDYYGDIQSSPELFVDAIRKTDSIKGIEKLQELLQAYEEKHDFMDNWYWQEYGTGPKEEDYEDPDEYKEATEKWEEEMQEAEEADITEARSKNLPWGFIDDIYRYLHKLREKGEIE